MNYDDEKRVIGKVVSVSADRFVVEMYKAIDNFTIIGFDGIHYVARLGSFLIIPILSDYIVVEIIGLREVRNFGKKNEDHGLNNETSDKFLDVIPVGTLPQAQGGDFRFGASAFPPLYSDVLYAVDDDLDRIFETQNNNETLRWKVLGIGNSSVFENYEVKIKINDFFGGHVAVLGNTGSGKSCTIASILQSLFEKSDEHRAHGATFLIFDVNGEYYRALRELPQKSESKICVDEWSLDQTNNEDGFQLPHRFLNLSEWELLLQASEKTQLPILRRALGIATLFSKSDEDDSIKRMGQHITATCVKEVLSNESSASSKPTRIKGILNKFQHYFGSTEISTVEDKLGLHFGGIPMIKEAIEWCNPFIQKDFILPEYKNEPFNFEDLEKAFELAILYDEAHGNRQIRDYCSSMLTRFKDLKQREEYSFLRCDGSKWKDKNEFLRKILGLEGDRKKNQIIIINMNAVEDEIIELVSAVLARMVFDLLRQTDPRNQFPVHLLLEEAHRYISAKPSRYAMDANHIYERIAKEGRKYGLFLIVASQQPSELSKTVLSQCSNFVVHRIQNPDDLLQIRQMTPFISESVLKRLPSLPKQYALVFGTSVNLATTFKVRNASPLPNSDDAKIVDLWFVEEKRSSALS